MNIKTLGIVIVIISVVGLGIGFLSNSQKNNNTSILGTESASKTLSVNTESVKPTEAPSTTPFIYLSPTPKVNPVAKYGERLNLNNGRYLTVFTPISDYKPEGGYPNPEAGKKYVIVEAEYGNQGDQKVACDPYTNFWLIDSQGNSFETYGMRVKKPSLDCTPDMEDSAYIQPKKSIRGFLTFLVNKDSEVAKIKYKSFQYNEEVYFSN